MNLDEIAPIPSDEPAPAPEPAPAEEPAGDVQEPAEAYDEPPAPLTPEELAERLSNAEKAATRLAQERREARRELEIERKLRQEMAEQFKTLRPQPEPKPEAANVEPDPQEDPEGWLRYNFEQNRKIAEEWRQMKAKEQEAAKAQAEFQSLFQETVRDYAEYAEEEAPDFNEAYAFIEKGLRSHYETTPIFDGRQLRLPTKAEVDRQCAIDETNFVRDLKAAGIRPAAGVYQFAQLKGYQRNAAVAQLAEGDRRRADAERVRGLPGASSSAEPTLTYEWVVENIDSPDPAKRARADKAWDTKDKLPRKR